MVLEGYTLWRKAARLTTGEVVPTTVNSKQPTEPKSALAAGFGSASGSAFWPSLERGDTDGLLKPRAEFTHTSAVRGEATSSTGIADGDDEEVAEVGPVPASPGRLNLQQNTSE